jgi:hypothetical protein
MKSTVAIAGLSLALALGAAALAAAPGATLALSILPGPPAAQSGQDIRVDVRVTNTSTAPVELSTSTAEGRAEFSYRIAVARQDKKPVAKTVYGRSLAGDGGQLIVNSNRLFTLKPGETRDDYFLLNRVYDVSKPGVYLVQVARTPKSGVAPLYSNKVEVVVQ